MGYYEKMLIKFEVAIQIFCNDSKIFDIVAKKFDVELVDRMDNIFPDFNIILDTQSNLSIDIRERFQSMNESVVVHGGTKQQMVTAKKLNINGKSYFYISKNNQYIERHGNYVRIFSLSEFDSNCLRIIREVLYRLCLSKGMIAVHAGAVEYKNGEAALIVGEKGAGKSTLLCKLLRNGECTYIDNDRVLIKQNPNRIVAYGMSSTVNIGYGTMKEYPDIFLEYFSAHEDSQFKYTFTTDKFVEKMKCDHKKQCTVSKVLFPYIDMDSSGLEYCSCERIYAKDILESQIEKVDTQEHPNWLEIYDTKKDEHNCSIKTIVDNITGSVDLVSVRIGIKADGDI